jgi:hypothetical protein
MRNSIKTFRPLFAAVRAHLDKDMQRLLGDSLYFIVRGDPPEEEAHTLSELRPALDRPPTPLPPGLFETFLVRLCMPEWERRGRFALWFYGKARLPGQTRRLRQLRDEMLPPALLYEVRLLLEKGRRFPAGARPMDLPMDLMDPMM